MFADTLVIDTADGSDVTYKRRSTSSSSSEYIDAASTASAPGLLAIKHTSTGKGNAAIDRHLVQFTRTVVDVNGNPYTTTVNFTVAVPRASAVTATVVKNLVANAIDFLADLSIASLATTANIESLLQGQT
jgi:hypothetical protein